MRDEAIVTTLILGCLLNLLLTAPVQAQIRKLNGGLEAQIASIGRDKSFHSLTVSMTLANKGNNTIYLLLFAGYNSPKATDSTGAAFAYRSSSGAPICTLSEPWCIGVPNVIQTLTPPLQNWLELDPDTSPIALNFQLYSNQESHGHLASFSCTFAYRVVADTGRDETLTERQKRDGIQTMNLSVPPMPVAEEP